ISADCIVFILLTFGKVILLVFLFHNTRKTIMHYLSIASLILKGSRVFLNFASHNLIFAY
ncbi:hypothetical protein D7242_12190, partial [Legionella pneumophila]